MTGTELNAWRQRLGLSITQAAKALKISRGRMVESLYYEKRPPSKATAETAHRLEVRHNQKGGGAT